VPMLIIDGGQCLVGADKVAVGSAEWWAVADRLHAITINHPGSQLQYSAKRIQSYWDGYACRV
jgi:hypothetical protein